MLIFLYGKDTYSSSRRLKQLKDAFADKYGDTNISIFDFKEKEIKIEEATAQIVSLPFLSSKRLVIFKNLLFLGDKQKEEKISELIDKVPETTVLVLIEKGEPDKRKALYKKIIRCSKTQEFNIPKGGSLSNWVKREVEKKGGRISFSSAERLAVSVGQNLWRLSNEIDKLINYSEGKEIKVEEINLLVQESIEVQIFDLIDTISTKNAKNTISILEKLLQSGENEIYILAMIVYGFRNLILVKEIQKETENQKEIAKRLKLHPFVVQKTCFSSEKFTYSELRGIYQKLLKADTEIKTGQKEAKLALTLLVMDICKEKVTNN